MLQVLFACARGPIDIRAAPLIDEREPSSDEHREWTRVRNRLRSDLREDEVESYFDMLDRLFAEAQPFSPRAEKRVKKHVVHPARIVAQIMAQREISVEKLAQALKSDAAELGEFLAERREISPELAENLARVLGHDKGYWLSFQ
jgi:hypothetical protein